MKYQIPQFIEVENKILGPLTFRHILIFLGIGGVLWVLWLFLKPLYWIAIALPTVLLTIFLSFAKINGRSSTSFFNSIFQYVLGAEEYVWKRQEKEEFFSSPPKRLSLQEARLKTPKEKALRPEEKIQTLAQRLDKTE